MTGSPCLARVVIGLAGRSSGWVHPRLERYLDFVSAWVRPNTTLTVGYVWGDAAAQQNELEPAELLPARV